MSNLHQFRKYYYFIGRYMFNYIFVNKENEVALCFHSVCCGFTSWQHLRLFHDGCQCALYDAFIVLPHWETGPLILCLDIPLRQIILIIRKQSFPYPIMSSLRLCSDTYQFGNSSLDSVGYRTNDLSRRKPESDLTYSAILSLSMISVNATI